MIDSYRVPVLILVFTALLAACGQGGQQQTRDEAAAERLLVAPVGGRGGLSDGRGAQ